MEIDQLSNICTSAGLILKSGQNTFTPIKLALDPYLIKKQQYKKMGQIHKVWQKLIYLSSKDHELIQNTFKNIAKIDKMIFNFFKIYQKAYNLRQNDFLMFTRIDFFKNYQEQFKIIQYNLTSVSMASHSQNYNRVKKYFDLNSKRKCNIQFLQNTPASDIASAVQFMYKQKKLQGIFLIVFGPNQKNIIDQTYIQIKLLQKGISSKRQSFQTLCNKIQIIDKKLYINRELISMVYYRTGYQPSDYCKNGHCDQCWKVRQIIELSDAIKIPNIAMQLMNQKRMQVQLSKKHIYKKYLNQDQCKILNQSLVFTADFEQNIQEINILRYIQEKGKDKFILKPNLEGGGNNIYGQKAYQLLKQLTNDQKKNYILMEKINTQPVENIVFFGNQSKKLNCICEISRYGILAETNGKISQNSCDGYLVRIKPQNQNQGGVMAGVGAICSMAIKQQIQNYIRN